jgi:hypothetical protein
MALNILFVVATGGEEDDEGKRGGCGIGSIGKADSSQLSPERDRSPSVRSECVSSSGSRMLEMAEFFITIKSDGKPTTGDERRLIEESLLLFVSFFVELVVDFYEMAHIMSITISGYQNLQARKRTQIYAPDLTSI